MVNKKALIILLVVIVLGCMHYNNITSTKDKENAESVVETIAPIIGPKQVMINDINGLMQMDSNVVHKYFGVSDIYKGEDVADRIAISKVTFISVDNNGTEITENLDEVAGIQMGKMAVNLHICTLDYKKTKEQVEMITNSIRSSNPNIAEDELTNQVTTLVAEYANNTGNLDVHTNVKVNIKYINGVGEVEVTEQLKNAITGGWYNPTGIILENTECILSK